jgi:hypothetical protein
MGYYILTFLFCFIIELDPRLKKNKIIRILFTIWIFAFFCFGYMVGSDWRTYELDFQQTYSQLESFKTTLYPGYYIFSDLFKFISEDFFVFRGFLNIIYLHSVFYLIKKIFGQINYVAIVFLMSTLLYMLIGGPLKFLCASIFIMYATGALLDGNIKKWFLITFISVFFHFAAVFVIALTYIIWLFRNRIIRFKNITILITYFIVLLLTFDTFLFEQIFALLPFIGLSDILTSKISGYYVENLDSLFTVGSLKNIVFFLIVLFSKNKIIAFCKNGKFIYAYSVSFAIIYRILLIIPSGFRISMYASIFFFISLLIVFYKSNNKFRMTILFKRFIVISLITIPLISNIWLGYDYLPYSNSIKHIILGDHLPYNYRFYYNPIESRKRTGLNYSI